MRYDRKPDGASAGGDAPRGRPRRRRSGRDRARKAARLAGVLVGVCIGGFVLGYAITGWVLFPVDDGDGVVSVPDLRGLAEREAVALLREHDLVLDPGPPLDHPTAPPGTVLTQFPLPGQEATRGAEVRVSLSVGRSRRPVPDVRGLDLRQAAQALERTGFRVRVDDVEDEAPPGRILSVRPEPRTMVELPATVHLIVSTGPATVEVPALAGMELDDARQALFDAGLSTGRVDHNRFSLRPPGTVTGQRPEPGQEIRTGSSVDLTVAGRAPVRDDPRDLEDDGR